MALNDKTTICNHGVLKIEVRYADESEVFIGIVSQTSFHSVIVSLTSHTLVPSAATIKDAEEMVSKRWHIEPGIFSLISDTTELKEVLAH